VILIVSIEEARGAIMKALLNYLHANCRRILSIAKITGQKYVKISLHGLYRHYKPEENFPRFIHAFELLRNKNELSRTLEIENLKIVKEDNEVHLLLSIEALENLCSKIVED